MLLDHLLSCFMQISSAGIIAQARPFGHHIAIFGGCQISHVWPALGKAQEIAFHRWSALPLPAGFVSLPRKNLHRMKTLRIALCLLLFPASLFAQLPAERSAYLTARQERVAADSALRYAGIPELSDREQQLDARMKALQRQMLDDYKAPHFFPPARYFSQSKAHIESTRLFQVIQNMPKGGIHHLHVAAGGDGRWVVQHAIETPAAYV